jgi:FkbM family methyltransferase
MKGLIPHWEFLSWARDRFGIGFALRNYLPVLLGIPIKVPVGSVSVWVRGGTADTMTYDEIIVGKEYALEVGEPEFIIDAGAHIGLSSVFFALRYPKARIVAIEPDDSNFALLKKNAAPFKNVTPIKAGLWSHETTLKISNPGADTWSFRVQEGQGIPAVTVPGLLQRFGRRQVDLLKIDIEGSEVELLKQSASWIASVEAMVIELHDRHVPGCTAVLEQAIKWIPFRRSVSGESVVLVREASVQG